MSVLASPLSKVSCGQAKFKVALYLLRRYHCRMLIWGNRVRLVGFWNLASVNSGAVLFAGGGTGATWKHACFRNGSDLRCCVSRDGGKQTETYWNPACIAFFPTVVRWQLHFFFRNSCWLGPEHSTVLNLQVTWFGKTMNNIFTYLHQ